MRPAQLVEFLQVEPEFCAGAEPVAEPDRGVGGDRTHTVDDASDPVDRDVDVARQRRRAHAESLQLLGQVLARMDRRACHMFASPVIVGDLDVDRPVRALGPFEADPPLVVDADAIVAFAVAAQGLQHVAGQGREVLQARGGFKPVEPNPVMLVRRSVWIP